jgi:hypothetical protein
MASRKLGSKNRRPNSRALAATGGVPEGTQVIPLTNLLKSYFGFDLWPAVGAAKKAVHIRPEVEEEIRQRLIWLRTKHVCLAQVTQRVMAGWLDVRDKVVKRDPKLRGFTLDFGHAATIELVTNVETFVVQLHATFDAAVALARLVERKVLTPARLAVSTALDAVPGVSAAERQLFERARDGFAHAQASWLSVLLLPDGRADLAIHTSQTPDFKAGTGYVLLSRADALLQAIMDRIDALEEELTERLNLLASACADSAAL